MKYLFKKLLISSSLLLFVSAVFIGCSSKTSDTTDSVTETPQESTDTGNDEIADIETQDSAETDTTVVETPTESSTWTSYPLSVANYSITDGVWTDKDQVFEAVPERVVATTQPTAELLIRLGLSDRIVGVAAVYGETPADIADEFAKVPVLSEGYVGKEITLGANPDFIIGRGDLYANADWGVGTIDDLNSMDIHTYAMNACRLGASLEDLYKDIKEIGEIFNVQENAAKFSDTLLAKEAALKALVPASDETLPLLYAYAFPSDGNITVYSGSTDTFQNDAMNLINLDNAFKDASGEISLEQFIATNPDVILMSYYSGGPQPQEMLDAIYSEEALQSLSAVQNKRVYVIEYNDFWSYGYQIFDGVEKLASEIYSVETTN